MRYNVTIGDRVIEIDFSGTTPTVNGKSVRAELATLPGTAVRHLLLDDRSHALVARPGGTRGFWQLTAKGKSVMAEVVDERTGAIRAMAGGVETATPKVLLAPMPGMVVRINVEPGQPVAAGQGVIVVEAMKMENELKSPVVGTVASVRVLAGQAVEKGAILMTFE